MIKLNRFFDDYRSAGALHELVSIEHAISETVLATKAGGLVTLIALPGVESPCLEPAELEAVTRAFESATKIFDERFRLYQYLFKREHPGLSAEPSSDPVVTQATQDRLRYLREKPGRLYTIETYVAVLLDRWNRRGPGSQAAEWMTQPVQALRARWSPEESLTALSDELGQSAELLENGVRSFLLQFSGLKGARVLSYREAFRVLRRLLNYAPEVAESLDLKSGAFMDVQACSSSLECHRDALRLGAQHAAVLTLIEPPAQTFAPMLDHLLELDTRFVIASEWNPADPVKVRRFIHSQRRHFHNSKTSLASSLSTGTGARPDALVNRAHVALVDDLGACLEAMELHGEGFGEFSLTLILYDDDPAALRRSVAQAFKLFGVSGAHLIEERYNRLNAWLAVLPGNSIFNVRRMWLSARNHADLSFLFTPDGGEVRDKHLSAEYLTVFEGRGGQPYFFNLHWQDVAHTFVLGATGSGKSFLLNFLLTHLQKYTAFTCIFDVGGSYESLTRLFSGSSFSLRPAQRPFRINPFGLPPTPENLLFLLAWVRVLIESGTSRLSAEDEQDLFEQIRNLYELEPAQRRLSTLAALAPPRVRSKLQRWTREGPYGDLFDNPEDTLTLSRFQTFDFEGMDQNKEALEPLLFYILHRASAAVGDDPRQFKVLVLDEAWRFLAHPVIKAYLTEALKTWRKKNAAVLLATQSGDDFHTSEMLPVIVESCPTQIFLANPRLDPAAYRQAFHLNATEIERIANLEPKKQLFLKRPDMAKVLDLDVGPREYWIYTSDPKETAHKRDLFARRGFEAGLDQLEKENA